MFHRPFCLGLILLCLSHCASKDPSTTPIEGTENSPDGPGYLVGIIEFVNPEQRFVLIKTQGAAIIPAGSKLTALDATGALSEIVVSPERKGAHLTADITTGQPRAGNLVVYQPNKGAAPATATAATSTPTPPTSSPDVEWREGQPPPLDPPAPPSLSPPSSPIPLQPVAPIPLDPLSPEPAKLE